MTIFPLTDKIRRIAHSLVIEPERFGIASSLYAEHTAGEIEEVIAHIWSLVESLHTHITTEYPALLPAGEALDLGCGEGKNSLLSVEDLVIIHIFSPGGASAVSDLFAKYAGYNPTFVQCAFYVASKIYG